MGWDRNTYCQNHPKPLKLVPVPGPVVRIVAADSNILINFIHLQRLDLLGHLPEYEFVMPEEVRGEITDPVQDAAVRTALDTGILRLVVIEDLPTLTLFAELTGLMGRGEGLAGAVDTRWLDHHRRSRLDEDAAGTTPVSYEDSIVSRPALTRRTTEAMPFQTGGFPGILQVRAGMWGGQSRPPTSFPAGRAA
jgi:hypothetical protein